MALGGELPAATGALPGEVRRGDRGDAGDEAGHPSGGAGEQDQGHVDVCLSYKLEE